MARNIVNIGMRPYHVFWANRFKLDPSWRVEAHTHPFHELIVIGEGRLMLRTKAGDLAGNPGDIFFYRAGMVHEEWADPESPAVMVAVAFSLSDKLSWMPLRARDLRGRVAQMALWITQDELNSPTRPMRPFLEAVVQELRYCCEHELSGWPEGVRSYMRSHLTETITLEDLARHGKMSKFAFLKKFKRMTGRTPMAELRFQRLDRARSLLQHTNLPVKAIAPQVGIGDEFQLSKLFRGHFGRTPSEVRRLGLPQ